jgi:Holliday junction DNA helicase RuvA
MPSSFECNNTPYGGDELIASLRGIVQHIGEDELVIEMGGVGLRVSIPHSVMDDVVLGKPLFLLTELVVRESSLSLYGFGSADQRDLFDLLMQVSGVGPRLALAILSTLSVDVIKSAVVNDQSDVLTRVPGVGGKTADKIIFFLKDRLKAPLEAVGIPSGVDTEVLGVLTTLGYSLVEAQSAIQSIPEDASEDVEERVKLALSYFASP